MASVGSCEIDGPLKPKRRALEGGAVAVAVLGTFVGGGRSVAAYERLGALLLHVGSSPPFLLRLVPMFAFLVLKI